MTMRTDPGKTDRWIDRQVFLFDIKLSKYWTRNEGVRAIRLTLNLICRLAPLESFGSQMSDEGVRIIRFSFFHSIL